MAWITGVLLARDKRKRALVCVLINSFLCSDNCVNANLTSPGDDSGRVTADDHHSLGSRYTLPAPASFIPFMYARAKSVNAFPLCFNILVVVISGQSARPSQ